MSKPPQKTVTRTQTCNCGQVEVQVTGVDKNAVICHCSNCQRVSGSAFIYNYRFMKSDIKITKGEDLVKVYVDSNTKSGNTLQRRFCSNCGCPLFLTADAIKGFVIVHGVQQDGATQPFMESFPEARTAWVGDLTNNAKL